MMELVRSQSHRRMLGELYEMEIEKLYEKYPEKYPFLKLAYDEIQQDRKRRRERRIMRTVIVALVGVCLLAFAFVSLGHTQGLFYLKTTEIEDAAYLSISGLLAGLPGSDMKAVPTTHPSLGEGFRLDLVGLADGTYTAIAVACDIWDNCGEPSDPFAFTKPIPVGKPGKPSLAK
jgi:hypothetical protein